MIDVKTRMVGDWVFFPEQNRYHQIEWGDCGDYEDVEINDDILEANDIISTSRRCYESKDGAFKLYYNGGLKGEYSLCFISECREYAVPVKRSVSSLQHALFHCGFITSPKDFKIE